MLKPLDYVSQIKPYVPGKPVSELERELGISNSVKLASNENPLGPSRKVVKAIKEFLKNPSEIGRYPDGGGYYLRTALSKAISRKNIPLTIDNFILGNGSNELIDIAVRTYMTHGDEAVMANPSFVVYSMAVRSVGANAIEIPLKDDFSHDLIKMSKAITKNTKMVFVSNPNNPTGTINKKDEFRRFMTDVPDDVLVVVDEAYYEYVTDKDYPDTLKYLAKGRNILILRTFSKAYGLAGLRIGYGISKPEIITEMNKIREPFNTNTPSQICALTALKDKAHLKKSIKLNEEGKVYMYSELDALGIKYIPSQTNFIYIMLQSSSFDLYNALLKEGVIIRPVGPKEIRVTIGLKEENQRFIDALKKVGIK
ncbi:MAG: histidinol-phosphate transaminase [Thermodesulfovibrionales bacterium]|nr:histidinol-phosphate transaminase [Thermodesulfovibrionales bacterium]